jgi:ribosomal protein S12 methylthiotransferase
LVERIRSRIPGVTFRTAFIVGFPGETDVAFEELKRYVEETEFDRVAAFLYSDEEGTPALALEKKIERSLMEERRNALLAVQEVIASGKSRERIGSTIEVLVDGPAEETEHLLEGRHEGLAPEIDGVVYINRGTNDLTRSLSARRDAPRLKPGDLVKVEIREAATYDLVGHVLS